MLFRRFGGCLLTPLSGSLLVSVVLGLQAHSKPFFCRFWTRRLTSQPSKLGLQAHSKPFFCRSWMRRLTSEAENWCTSNRDTMLLRRFGGWLLTPLSGSLLVSVVLGLQAPSKPFFCRFWTQRLTLQPSKRRPKIGAREPATPCCRRFGGWLLTPLSGSLLVSVVLGLQAHSKPFFCRFWTQRLTSQPSKRRPKIGAREPATPCCFAVSEGGFWRPFLALCWSL